MQDKEARLKELEAKGSRTPEEEQELLDLRTESQKADEPANPGGSER